MDIIRLAVYVIIAVIIIYVAVLALKEMITMLWTISPLTCIGFVVSIGIAFWKGQLAFYKGVKNLQILFLIFVGTVISHYATSEFQTLWNNFIAGNLVGAAVIGVVILILLRKGQEIKNLEP